MNYKTWNLRNLPLFKEELKGGPVIGSASLKDFAITTLDHSYYRHDEIERIVNYLNHCVGIIATSMLRENPLTGKTVLSYALFTDGEVIFNNLWIEYVKSRQVAIPEMWLEIIRHKEYNQLYKEIDVSCFEEKYDLLEIACSQTFDEEFILKGFLH